MPFDALIAPTRPRLLAGVLREQGLRPVSWQALAEHKRAQLETFRPSFWHQHQTWLPVGLIGSVGCMAASGGFANRIMPASMLPSWLALGWMCVIALLVVFGVFRGHAGSQWQERCVAGGWLRGLGVPEPIAAIALSLHRETPGSTLILGELVQEEAVLDPYLLLENDGELVCLGIWDNGRVIACAEETAPRLGSYHQSTIDMQRLPGDVAGGG
jgi:hypothetical protein